MMAKYWSLVQTETFLSSAVESKAALLLWKLDKHHENKKSHCWQENFGLVDNTSDQIIEISTT